MGNFFLNPAMLLGLAGLSLPVIVHLLSRRRHDVVEWGAMQFLELGREARRRLQLEQILLMLLRMALIALLVFALARPWVQGGIWGALAERNSRDIVILLDGSYSMDRQDLGLTPDESVRNWLQEFAEGLQPGDTVRLLDVRARIRSLTDGPTRDARALVAAVENLPAPSGSANLPLALTEAIHRLADGSNLSREILVLTDRQAQSWRLDDSAAWAKVDEALAAATVKPRILVLEHPLPDSSSAEPSQSGSSSMNAAVTNFSLDRLRLSRDRAVPDFPIRVQTRLTQHTGPNATERTVTLAVDGQRLADQTRVVRVPADGSVDVEFTFRLTTPGSHWVSVEIEEDTLPGDNTTAAAFSVTPAVPVLLVDGQPSLEPTQSETYFLSAALSPTVAASQLIKTQTVAYTRLTATDLDGPQVVVLADVPQLTPAQQKSLTEFVERGGGLLVTLGDRIDVDFYNHSLAASADAKVGLLPVKIAAESPASADDDGDIRIADVSLQLPWLTPFRQEDGGEFHQVRFQKWWPTTIANPQPPADEELSQQQPTAVVLARLENVAPLMVSRALGDGRVVVLTSPLDLHAGWNTLPARRNTFVPLLYETVFFLAGRGESRTVELGQPLMHTLPRELSQSAPDKLAPDNDADHTTPSAGNAFVFMTPDDRELPAISRRDGRGRLILQCLETDMPGVYQLKSAAAPLSASNDATLDAGFKPIAFAVQQDRMESDLTPLTEPDRLQLTSGDRMSFLESTADLWARLADDAPRAELFRYLMFGFLAMLIGEVVMTRRLVRGGHADVKLEENSPDTSPDEQRQSASQAATGAAGREGGNEYADDDEFEFDDHEQAEARMWSPSTRVTRDGDID